jgi:ABC-type dipeptide/oligopeptide/nickel transport system permease component
MYFGGNGDGGSPGRCAASWGRRLMSVGWRYFEHVGYAVIRAAAVTAWLALGGALLVAIFAVPAAMLAASRVGSFYDKTV